MKKIVAWMLALCLLLSCVPGALAAPVRDRAGEEPEIGLQMLVNLAMGAAVLRDENVLTAGEQPSQALVEGVLALGMYTLQLPYSGGDELFQGKPTLTDAEIAALYTGIFASGEYVRPAESSCPCIALTADGMTMDLSELQENPAIGAYIYETAGDDDGVTVQCDLFTYWGEFGQNAEDLPEEALTWLCHGEVSLRYDEDALFGYTLAGYSLSDTYADGMLSDWQTAENTEYEYSVNLPSIFGLADEAAACRVWQTADGEATLTIEALPGGVAYADALAAFMQENPDASITEEAEFSQAQFLAQQPGQIVLCVVADGVNWRYTVTLSFPEARQAEFALYAQFIRNSMQVWGASNG